LIGGLGENPHTLDDYAKDALFFQYLEDRFGQARLVRIIQAVLRGVSVTRACEQETGLSWSVLEGEAKEFGIRYIDQRMQARAAES
jgi:hypothetical protein